MKAILRSVPFVFLLLLTSSVSAAPNIVLISVDTLRARNLPTYGYPASTAPFLDSLAKKGIVFEDATVPLPNTTPSHASMLTGLDPSKHGSNGLGIPIRTGVDTLAAALKRKGYVTASSVAVSHVGSSVNLNQGFTFMREPGSKVARRTGTEVNADAIKLIDLARRQNPKAPFFLFVHYFDCHAPYGWSRGYTTNPMTLPKAERIRRYDEAIRFVDDLIRGVYDELAKRKLLDNTIICITSDHGEQIDDHGLAAGHADIYSETVNVPLIFVGPGIPATRVPTRVSNLDIAPTLAAAAGATLKGTLDGKNILPEGGVGKVLYSWRGPKDLKERDLLVVGNPWYTRSISVLSRKYAYIKNFDHVYGSFRAEYADPRNKSQKPLTGLKALTAEADKSGGTRFALPATSYAPYVVTLELTPKSACRGTFTVSMAPGFKYFTVPMSDVGLRAQFSAARLDMMWLAVKPATCRVTAKYRLDRPADAPRLAGQPIPSDLSQIIYSTRKRNTSDELYDLETDPKMLRNLIKDASLSSIRSGLEARTKKLYTSTYGAAFGDSGPTLPIPREEMEKLKSLGYVF